MYIGQEQTNYHNHKYNNNNKSLTKKVGESERKRFFWMGMKKHVWAYFE